MDSEETIFQKIIRGEVPCTKIYEDDDVLAFLDIQPSNPGHTLVIPKKRAVNIYDMDEDSVKKVFVVVQKVARAIKKGLPADGVNLAMNNDPAADQEVFHVHIHVIPRFKNDGFFHGRHLTYKEGEMEEVARKIRSEL